MSALARFLEADAKVDPRIVAYITNDLQLSCMLDFANYWMCSEYAEGMKDVVQQIYDFQSPALQATTRVQVERLCAAWRWAKERPRELASGPATGTEKAGGRVKGGSFHYVLERHELGGKNRSGGYGGPLCEDPFGDEVCKLVEQVLAESECDRGLAFSGFTDPRPEPLTREQVASCKGFDYGDKTLRLPCGPLPWPAGLPEPGYVPKTNPLHGRWITVSGGQAAFIREAIKAGMVGAAEAKKIDADADQRRTGGMYLRINQLGDVVTVDASVNKFARAKRTWKSGHYFYEPLVSGGNLLGVWVTSEEYCKVGFFWEMESGRCFRIERRVLCVGPYTFLRQATEFNGKVSFILYVKVSDDPESQPGPLQSRDYTALAGQDNVCTTLGKPYPCTARDLDHPKQRDTWLDENEEEMVRQRERVASAFR